MGETDVLVRLMCGGGRRVGETDNGCLGGVGCRMAILTMMVKDYGT